MDLSNVPPTPGWRQFTIIAFHLPINSHEEYSQQATNKNCCDALSTAYTWCLATITNFLPRIDNQILKLLWTKEVHGQTKQDTD